MLDISDKVNKIPLIGPKYQDLLKNLEIETIRDLIFHFPRRYSDTSEISKISDLDTFTAKTIICDVEDIQNIRTKYRKFITQALVSDESGSVDVIWFNQPYIGKIIKKGTNVLLNGKLNPKRNKPQLYSPEYEPFNGKATTHLGRIIPIYPLSEGITNKWIRSKIKYLLTKHAYLFEITQSLLPQNLEECYGLIDFSSAMKNIHFPKSKILAKRSRERIAFEELLQIHTRLLRKKQDYMKVPAPVIKKHNEKIKNFLEDQSFVPTNAQKTAIEEITNDFYHSYPANISL